MKKLVSYNLKESVHTLRVYEGRTRYFAYNSRLGDTWVTDNPRELVDLILDNTPIFIDEARIIMDMLERGDIRTIEFKMRSEEDEGS